MVLQACHYFGNAFSLLSATEYHLGLLKAKLAKYRAQLLEPSGKTGAKVSGSLSSSSHTAVEKLSVSYMIKILH